MSKNTKFAEEYVKDILVDNRSRIVKEETTEYQPDQITRLYEFEDGAVIKYEWQDISLINPEDSESYNHKFTLVKLPSPNPHKLRKSVVKVINYDASGR